MGKNVDCELVKFWKHLKLFIPEINAGCNTAFISIKNFQCI